MFYLETKLQLFYMGIQTSFASHIASKDVLLTTLSFARFALPGTSSALMMALDYMERLQRQSS